MDGTPLPGIRGINESWGIPALLSVILLVWLFPSDLFEGHAGWKNTIFIGTGGVTKYGV